MRLLYLTLFVVYLQSAFGATHNLTLRFQPNTLQLVDSNTLPIVSIADTNTVHPFLGKFSLNDSLVLKVINADTLSHNFTIENYVNSSLISSYDSSYFYLKLNKEGTFIIFDEGVFPNNQYSSISGLLAVEQTNIKTYFWNVREFQSKWHQDTFTGAMNPLLYYPDYFTVNNLSNPNVDSHADSRVAGSVGDTIHLVIANTGLSIHSMHFHGYHLKILNSSKHPETIGRSKDTFPLYPMEVLKLELIPDKPGVYPVHDHNLIGVTGGMFYPNGMFTTLRIVP